MLCCLLFSLFSLLLTRLVLVDVVVQCLARMLNLTELSLDGMDASILTSADWPMLCALHLRRFVFKSENVDIGSLAQLQALARLPKCATIDLGSFYADLWPFADSSEKLRIFKQLPFAAIHLDGNESPTGDSCARWIELLASCCLVKVKTVSFKGLKAPALETEFSAFWTNLNKFWASPNEVDAVYVDCTPGYLVSLQSLAKPELVTSLEVWSRYRYRASEALQLRWYFDTRTHAHAHQHAHTQTHKHTAAGTATLPSSRQRSA